MVDGAPKKFSRTLRFLRRHAEKVFLGGALGSLVLYGGIALAPNGADAAALKPVFDGPQVEKSRRHPALAAPPVRPWFEQFHGLQNTVIECRAGNPWAATALPVLIGVKRSGPPVKRAVILFPEVVLGAARAGPHAVGLNWSVNPAPPPDKAQKEVEHLTYPITHFHIERETAGQGDWVAVGELPPEARTFRDGGVLPLRKYNYRVIGAHEKAESVALTPEPVVTPDQWKLTFSNADAAGRLVYVRIEKQDRTHGLVVKSHIVVEGQRIGWWSEEPGKDPVSTHWVPIDSKPALVDLDTGVTLVAVRQEKIESVHRKCARKLTPIGPVCVDAFEKVKVSTTAIVLSDAERVWTVSKPAVTDQDLRCPVHRGK